MSKTKMWAGVILALVLIVTGFWYFQSKKTSIQDAQATGEPMTCTYQDSVNESAVTLSVQGEKFRSVSTMDGATRSSVFDGAVYYLWTDGNPNGSRFTRACVTEGGKNIESPEKSFENAKKVSCQEGSTVDLTIPLEVTFVDQCDLTMQSVQMLQYLEMQKRLLPEDGQTLPQ